MRLRLAGVESAGGVRPDRGYLQPQQRFLAKFDGPTLAKTNGSIIVEQSRDPGAETATSSLPGERIYVVFCSDESGTTDNFRGACRLGN